MRLYLLVTHLVNSLNAKRQKLFKLFIYLIIIILEIKMEKPKERHWRFQRQSVVTLTDGDKTSGGGWRIGGVQSQGEEEELKITHAAFVSELSVNWRQIFSAGRRLKFAHQSFSIGNPHK